MSMSSVETTVQQIDGPTWADKVDRLEHSIGIVFYLMLADLVAFVAAHGLDLHDYRAAKFMAFVGVAYFGILLLLLAVFRRKAKMVYRVLGLSGLPFLAVGIATMLSSFSARP